MRLLDFPAAPNPRRTRIFIAEKGIDVPIEAVDVAGGAHRTPEFRATVNPFALLPVLVLDDGTYLAESVAICRYLESLYPEPPLFGRDARDTAVVEMWNRRMELDLFRHVGDYFRHTASFFADRYAQSKEVGEDARRLALECLSVMDTVLADRPFIAGKHFTIADITAWVSIDLGIPSAFEIPAELPNVARWFDSVSNRPATRA